MKYDEIKKIALKHFLDGEYEKAIKLYEKLIDENLNDIVLAIDLAHFYNKNQQFKKSLEFNQKYLINQNTKLTKLQNQELLYEKGVSYSGLGEYKKSVEILLIIESEYAYSIIYNYHLVRNYYYLKNYEKMKKYVRICNEIKKLPEINYFLYLTTGNCEDIECGKNEVSFKIVIDKSNLLYDVDKKLFLNYLEYNLVFQESTNEIEKSCLSEVQNEYDEKNFFQILKSSLYSIKRYCGRGKSKKDMKNYEGAIKDYNQRIEVKPKYAEVYTNRGVLKADTDDTVGAMKDYNKAIEINPKYADAYNHRGILKKTLEDTAGAMDDYNKAIEINPKYADAYNHRGNLKKELGDIEGAMEDYNQAIELNPNNAKAYTNRGNLKKDLEDNYGAMDDYNQAIELNPKCAEVYNNRGMLKQKIGDTAGAMDDYNKAIEINPKYAEAYTNRGILKVELGDIEGAMDY